ncbi:MAG TPA: hypothetical protein VE619_03735 [Nitrososphaeraceae archaeon]|nr:hypothetical protein [Nitrososphaeraceae archaeon]
MLLASSITEISLSAPLIRQKAEGKHLSRPLTTDLDSYQYNKLLLR